MIINQTCIKECSENSKTAKSKYKCIRTVNVFIPELDKFNPDQILCNSDQTDYFKRCKRLHFIHKIEQPKVSVVAETVIKRYIYI